MMVTSSPALISTCALSVSLLSGWTMYLHTTCMSPLYTVISPSPGVADAGVGEEGEGGVDGLARGALGCQVRVLHLERVRPEIVKTL